MRKPTRSYSDPLAHLALSEFRIVFEELVHAQPLLYGVGPHALISPTLILHAPPGVGSLTSP